MKNTIISLDYHGVLDKDPEFFTKLANLILSIGGEIHVVSGLNLNDLQSELFRLKEKHGFKYTTTFSVEDYLLGTGVEYEIINGNKIFPDHEWNSAKGKYCKKIGCTLHYDDSPEYEPYFETPFVLVK